MANLTWSSLRSGPPAFHVFRRDDAVVRTLQGSQVAVHEYRMAFENLLTLTQLERESWQRSQMCLEDEVRALTVRNAEAERRMKDLLSRLHAGLMASEEALSRLDAEHQLLQQSSEETTNNLLQRVDALQRTVAALQSESLTLQTELAAVQSDAAQKDAALHQVARLETALAALQQRARTLVADLERDKTSAEQQASCLSSDLSAVQLRLAREAEARAASDTAAARLALERQQLAAALELERLINEPLRHTHYATTTTLAHVMRSPVAPTVRNRAGQPQPTSRAASTYIAPRKLHPPAQLLPHSDLDRPRSAPPGGAAGAAAAAASPAHPVSPSQAAQESVGSFSFSPQRVPAAGTAAARASGLYPGHVISSRTLTRLGRSWATTTATAGLPHPAYTDNLHSPLSPPPPGPPRRRPATASVSSPAHSPSRPSPAVQRTRSSGGGSRGGSSGGGACSTGPGAGGAEAAARSRASGGSTGGASQPQHLTSMLRSPGTPGYAGSTIMWVGGGTPGEGAGTGQGMEVTARPYSPLGNEGSGGGEGLEFVTPPRVSGRGLATGKEAMRASIGKGAWAGGDGDVERGTPSTQVYG